MSTQDTQHTAQAVLRLLQGPRLPLGRQFRSSQPCGPRALTAQRSVGGSRTRRDRRRGSDNLRSPPYSRDIAALDSRETSALHSREAMADSKQVNITCGMFETISTTCGVLFIFSATCLACCVVACKTGSASAAAPCSATAPQHGKNGPKCFLHLEATSGPS